MSFLNPTLAFAALACVAAPIIIHLLFRRKRRPVEWGAMRFVMEAFRRHRKRLRLEQILLLIARTLAVLLLALAVGRPMLAGSTPLEARRPRDLLLLIDNSIASQVRAGSTTEFDSHKQAAIRLLDELNPTRGDRAAVITLGSPSDRIVAPPSADLSAVRGAIEQMEATDAACDLSGASALVRDLAGKDPKRDTTVALLSGLRTGSIDAQHEASRGSGSQTEPHDSASEAAVALLSTPPATEPADNCSIVSIDPLRSILLRSGENVQTQQARVQLRRSGSVVERAGLITLRLRAATAKEIPDDQSWAKTEVRFSPGQETASVLAQIGVPKQPDESSATTSLWIEARIDEDAISADNVFRRPWKSRQQVGVLIVAPPAGAPQSAGPESFSAADWFTLALSPNAVTRGVGLENEHDPVRVLRIDPGHFSPSDLASADCVFVTRPDLLEAAMWPLLGDFARKGGLLVVTPGPQPGVQLWSDEFVKSVGVSWTFARENKAIEPPASLRSASIDQPLLSALSAELPELIKPVTVSRILGVDLKGDGIALISLDAQRPFLIESRPGASGKGLIVVFLASPELAWTNLPAMPLMLPLVQEIVRQGIGIASGPNNLVAGATLESPDDLRRIEPPATSATEAVARRAGLWRRVDQRGTTRDLIAVNPDSQAASTGLQTKEQVAPFFKNWLHPRDVVWIDPASRPASGSRNLLSQTRNSPPIDLPLLIAALSLLLADVALSRWFSHATVASTAQAGSANSGDTPATSQSPVVRGAAA